MKIPESFKNSLVVTREFFQKPQVQKTLKITAIVLATLAVLSAVVCLGLLISAPLMLLTIPTAVAGIAGATWIGRSPIQNDFQQKYILHADELIKEKEGLMQKLIESPELAASDALKMGFRVKSMGFIIELSNNLGQVARYTSLAKHQELVRELHHMDEAVKKALETATARSSSSLKSLQNDIENFLNDYSN